MARFGYLPAAEAPPAEHEVQAVARTRRTFRRQWQWSRRDEWIRRARYRRPVAAAGHD